ncbi:SDR family NAD(P)-dependent oxidoreductase, partial [Mycolicibacterium sp. CBMA 361]|uniref:SDR family NAD(P)-dependent oxidoreductase n=1 Tax=Mycolicibacterium sp. CBMA 361 TaxID=2606610 RepID=UPI001EF03E94
TRWPKPSNDSSTTVRKSTESEHHMNRYTDRVVAISGAAQGLGLAMATRFAAEGATVAIADINEKALADSATSIATAGGAKHRSDAVDVTDSAQVANWIDGVVAEFGRIDVLINNAGIIRDNRLQDIDDEDWRAVLDVSLTGSFYCARAAFGPMKHQGYGRIISMSSMSWRGNFGQSNYVAAKAGIVGLTRTSCNPKAHWQETPRLRRCRGPGPPSA